MRSTSLRLFVAIELPEDVRDLLGEASRRLAGAVTPPRVKWVEPANAHLTVKFLGDADPGKLEPIAAALERATRDARPIEARVRGVGAFPGPHRPRTIWAGLEAPPSLRALVEAVEREVSPLGFPTEKRPWSPHVTVGRVKEEERGRGAGKHAHDKGSAAATGSSPALADRIIREASLESRPFQIDAVTLFESALSSAGPTYTARSRATLRGAGT